MTRHLHTVGDDLPDDDDALEAPTPAPGPEAIKHGTLREWIYARIRRSIILGEYAAGMRLNEKRLAEALQVSRVPLRESFHNLERDGFIAQEPRRSAVVTGWDVRRVDDLFDVRVGLEVEATGVVARRVGRGEMPPPDLRDLVDGERDALERREMLEVAEISTEFHTRIVALTGNELMISLMAQIAQRMTWMFYMTSARDPRQACVEHEDLLEVIATGNEALARSVAHSHIEKGRLPTLRVMNLPASASR